jgi:hypothetical protein
MHTTTCDICGKDRIGTCRECLPVNNMKEKLLAHVGHRIEVVTYNYNKNIPVNVSIECEDCNVVLYDEDIE